MQSHIHFETPSLNIPSNTHEECVKTFDWFRPNISKLKQKFVASDFLRLRKRLKCSFISDINVLLSEMPSLIRHNLLTVPYCRLGYTSVLYTKMQGHFAAGIRWLAEQNANCVRYKTQLSRSNVIIFVWFFVDD